MNKKFDEFEKLLTLAKQENHPTVDVVHQVLFRIGSTESRYDRPLTLVAAWSTMAAALIAVVSAYAFYTTTDPISPILALATTMTP